MYHLWNHLFLSNKSTIPWMPLWHYQKFIILYHWQKRNNLKFHHWILLWLLLNKSLRYRLNAHSAKLKLFIILFHLMKHNRQIVFFYCSQNSNNSLASSHFKHQQLTKNKSKYNQLLSLNHLNSNLPSIIPNLRDSKASWNLPKVSFYLSTLTRIHFIIPYRTSLSVSS